MILSCASCSTRYFTDDGAIGPQGRQVRCAACGHTWFVEPHLVLDLTHPEPVMELSPDAKPPLTREQVERMRKSAQAGGGQAGGSATAKARELQARRQRQEKLRGAAIAWGGAAAAAAVVLTVAGVFRENIVRAWPNAASAYAAVGMDVNIYGLEFSDLRVEKSLDSGAPKLVVSGAVRNIGRHAKTPPVLRFGLRDDSATEVAHWLARLDPTPIAPGAATRFVTAFATPPGQSADLEATFASADEAREAPPYTPAELILPPPAPHQAHAAPGAVETPLGPEIISPGVARGLPPSAAPGMPADTAQDHGAHERGSGQS